MHFKICTKCGKEKELSEFHKQKDGKFGVRGDCKSCRKEYYKDYSKNYRKNNKDYFKNYYEINKKELLKTFKQYYKKNKEKMLKQIIKNNKIRYQKNLRYKLEINLRRRVNLALKGKDKALSTMFLIGCEIDYLMYHLQEQFQLGMSWDNYGLHGWHIDHIKPCAKFDLSIPEEQHKCFNFKNLQPLWAIDNYRKSDRYE